MVQRDIREGTSIMKRYGSLPAQLVSTSDDPARRVYSGQQRFTDELERNIRQKRE